MLNLAKIKQIILEQKDNFLRIDDPIERDILNGSSFLDICRLRETIIVTGVRRSGKSYLMKLIWKRMQAEFDVDQNNFLYINFESEKMLDFTIHDFDLLLQAYGELFSINKQKKIYLFFDEIQNILHWEKFISRIMETEKYKIFITGSNASLLSKEIGTALTGRNIILQLHPLSFVELLRYRTKRKVINNDWYDSERVNEIKKCFASYLILGGFPEVIKSSFRPILEEYLRNIIYRDIVLRRHIKYEASLREIVLFLTSNIGVPLSLASISKMTKVKNLMTVKNYLSYLEDSFLLYFIPKHSFSVKQQIYNPDKAYICDIGMYNEINLSPGGNTGRALENIVFNELSRRGYNVFYYQDKKECDFVFGEKNKITGAIQVSSEINENNKEREIEGLLSAVERFDLKEGFLITTDEEGEITVNNIKIRTIPIYKWLLY